MGNSELDTSLLDNAIRFAVQAHAGTERRGKGFPYIVHPLEAMAIVATMTSDQELLAAAALHDILEDTDLTVEDLRKTFGDRIARIVEEESDTEFPGTHAADSWHDRKRIAMQHLRTASPDAKIVALGDKLSNMRAIARDYALQGNTPGRKASPRRKPCFARQWKTTRQRSLLQSLKTSRWAVCWICGWKKN